MTTVFLRLANMGIAAGWIVLGLFLVRLLIRKAPKWITCLLWGIVGLRLVLPVAPASNLSLLPSAQPIPMDITSAAIPRVQTGIPAVNNVANPVLEKTSNLPQIIHILSIVWLAGVAVMLLYGVFSYLWLRRKVAVSVSMEPKVIICDNIDTPFVLGLFRPAIYLPSDLQEDCKEAVLAHERAHIRRHDHWWKPLGFFLLSVYWFNPLLWGAYILLCRDIEAACDEKVIKTMELEERKDNSMALAQCSVHRMRVLTCPVAFGELSVKSRIRAVLSYKKPAFWIVIGAVVLCVAADVCFLTIPKPCDHQYTSQITAEATCTEEGLCTYTCSLCEDVYKEPVPMLEHNYEMGDVITEADCVQPGLANFTCADCGHSTQLEIGLNDAHQYVSETTKESTCVEAGEIKETCSLCGDVKISEAPLADHHYEINFTIEGHCLREGVQNLKCTGCGKEIAKSLPRGDHEWIGGTTAHCRFCGMIKRRTNNYQNNYNSSSTNPLAIMPSPFELMNQLSITNRYW